MAKTKKRSTLKTFPYDTAEYLDTPERIAAYLVAALETGDAAFIAESIGIVARARGMTEIARKTGLSRESLYRSLNGETKAEFETVVRVLDALGVKLSAKPKAA